MVNNKVPTWTTRQVYVLIPNLIGYVRGILLLGAFCVCFSQPYWFISLYGMSQLLDGLDGYMARRMRQVSVYGTMLDMVLDRISTTALLVILAGFYATYTRWIIVIMVVDMVSHFIHVYSSLLDGRKSHKIVAEKYPWILRVYYGYKPVLFVLCMGSEACLLWLYIQNFEDQLAFACYLQPCLRLLITYVLGFVFLSKQVVHVAQLLQAMADIARVDARP